MSRICRQCSGPVGPRAPSAYLCIKCALANTRPKKWTLKNLRERYDTYAVGENHHGHGYIGCFLDWLEEQNG